MEMDNFITNDAGSIELSTYFQKMKKNFGLSLNNI